MNERDIFASIPGASAVTPEVEPTPAPTSLPMLGTLEVEGIPHQLIAVDLAGVEALSFDQAPMWPFTEAAPDSKPEEPTTTATSPIVGLPNSTEAEEGMLAMRELYVNALAVLAVHDEAVAAVPDTRSTNPNAVHNFMNDTSERSVARNRDATVQRRSSAVRAVVLAESALQLAILTAASQTNPFGTAASSSESLFQA